MKKKLLLAVSIMVVLASALSLFQIQPSNASNNSGPKISICHGTNSASNPYDKIEVSVSSADGGFGNGDHYNEHKGPIASSQSVAEDLKDDHDDWGDIIPPVPGFHSGLNWTTLGQAMYNNDCNYVTQVTPTTVSFVNPTCSTSNGSYTIPSKTGVVYKIGSTVKAAGTYSAANGTTVTIDAYKTNDGYLLTGTTTWTHTFAPTQTCVTPTAVTFVDPICDENGSYTIPSKTGVVYKIGSTVKAAGTYSATNGQTITVTAYAASGTYALTGTTTWTHTFAPTQTCVTPTAVTFVDPTCDVDGSYTIPSKTGVVYKINGDTVPANSYAASVGTTVTVTAYPVSGAYLLTGTTTWTHDFSIEGDCVTDLEVDAVTFIDPTCEAQGSYTVPTAATGVVYKIGSDIVEAGTYSAVDGDIITVVAYPTSESYTLVGTTTWTHEFFIEEECTQEQFADIKYGVECSTTGAVVTLTNSGNASGEVTVNDEVIVVAADATVERTFDTTDAGLQITIIIGEQTVYDELVICDTGDVLGDTDKPVVLPYTSGNNPLSIIAALVSTTAVIGLASIVARKALTRS